MSPPFLTTAAVRPSVVAFNKTAIVKIAAYNGQHKMVWMSSEGQPSQARTKGGYSVAQFQVECIDTTTEEDQSQYSKFVLEPLERGQGTTVGNALRRVLLSNLNMKKLVFRTYSSQPQIGRLLVQGQSTVTAENFDLPSEVELVDPTQYVATLSPNATLEMEFKIEKGKGYRGSGKLTDETALDFLQIDSVFMPVRKVQYSVEDARQGGTAEKDRLIMEIWTNGSMTPQEALSQAANILVDLFNPLKDITFEPSDDDGLNDERIENQIPIEELQLSVRAYNCLKRAQINSVADLLDYSQEDLLEIKNFGAKSAEEVVEALQQRLGITLPQEKSKS
jgi:DNA-directed RNA polymerase subunit alpha